MTKRGVTQSAFLGAAFLMATSAIGPGFLTQTTVFTQQLQSSFGFAILISILLDIGAQLTIWRVLSVTNLRAPELANKVVPGLGGVLAVLIAMGGLAFNIANAGGSGMGINVLTGWPVEWGAIVSGAIALLLFWIKEAGKAIDAFAKVLGFIMIGLTLYVAIKAHPPILTAAHHAIVPEKIDWVAVVTLVGGTVGGYISFAGAHRLLDAGITGKENLTRINRSAVSGIVVTGVMRLLLFLAVLGVVTSGASLDDKNPAASVFQSAAGNVGYAFFGLVLWSAAITSIVGCAYTSVSFLRSVHPVIKEHYRLTITLFIVFSVIVFVIIGNPVKLLVAAGAINGIILPLSLAIILVALQDQTIMKGYQHPWWMKWFAWLVVIAMSVMSVVLFSKWLSA
jgi:Mn2+/Fe2+ NRAMP family transporter